MPAGLLIPVIDIQTCDADGMKNAELNSMQPPDCLQHTHMPDLSLVSL